MIRVMAALRIAAALLVSGLSFSLQAAETAPPIHHAADVRLDVESRRLTVVDVITLHGRKEFRFHLAPWMAVESMVLDGQAVPVPARPSFGERRCPMRNLTASNYACRERCRRYRPVADAAWNSRPGWGPQVAICSSTRVGSP